MGTFEKELSPGRNIAVSFPDDLRLEELGTAAAFFRWLTEPQLIVQNDESRPEGRP